MATKFVFFVLGVLFVFALAFVASNNKKKIRYKSLFIILAVQLLLCFFMLQSNIGTAIIGYIDLSFEKLLECAHEGTQFIFGNLTDTKGGVFFFSVGMPIVVMSALIGVLQHFRILPVIIKFVGFILSKVTGFGRLESFNAVSSLSVGQSENFIAYKNILDKLPENVLFTMAATAMSTVSLAIAGAYIQMLSVGNGFDPRYVVVAMVLNMFGTFFVLTIINPYDRTNFLENDNCSLNFSSENKLETQSFFEMLAEYILDGFKVAVIVCAMLIGFLALLHLVDMIFKSIFGLSFTEILGYIFYPVAYILDIPKDQLNIAGQVMGTKMVSNEFAAIHLMTVHVNEISAHTKAVLSVFLISFANFSSIGIIIGAIQALSKKAAISVARSSIKILYGATLVSVLSATVVGLFV